MNRAILVLVALTSVWSVIVLGGVAVASGSESAHYENKEHGYSFDIDAGWKKLEKPQDGFDVAFLNIPADETALNSTILVAFNDLPEGKSFDAAAQDFMVGFSKSVAGYELEKKSDDKLDGVTAIRFVAKAQMNGKDVKLIAVASARNGKFIGILMSTPVEKAEQDLKVYDGVLLKSFKFSK